MGRQDEMRTRGRARIVAQHVADLVDADVAQAQLREHALQFLAAGVFLERRRRNLAEADLVRDRLRLGRFRRVDRGFHRRILQQIGWRRRGALSLNHTRRQRQNQHPGKRGSQHVNLR